MSITVFPLILNFKIITLHAKKKKKLIQKTFSLHSITQQDLLRGVSTRRSFGLLRRRAGLPESSHLVGPYSGSFNWIDCYDDQRWCSQENCLNHTITFSRIYDLTFSLPVAFKRSMLHLLHFTISKLLSFHVFTRVVTFNSLVFSTPHFWYLNFTPFWVNYILKTSNLHTFTPHLQIKALIFRVVIYLSKQNTWKSKKLNERKQTF